MSESYWSNLRMQMIGQSNKQLNVANAAKILRMDKELAMRFAIIHSVNGSGVSLFLATVCMSAEVPVRKYECTNTQFTLQWETFLMVGGVIKFCKKLFGHATGLLALVSTIDRNFKKEQTNLC